MQRWRCVGAVMVDQHLRFSTGRWTQSIILFPDWPRIEDDGGQTKTTNHGGDEDDGGGTNSIDLWHYGSFFQWWTLLSPNHLLVSGCFVLRRLWNGMWWMKTTVENGSSNWHDLAIFHRQLFRPSCYLLLYNFGDCFQSNTAEGGWMDISLHGCSTSPAINVHVGWPGSQPHWRQLIIQRENGRKPRGTHHLHSERGKVERSGEPRDDVWSV